MTIKEKTLKKSNNVFANRENGELWYLRGGYHNLTYFLDEWSLCPSETIPVDNKGETFLKFYNDKGELFGGFYPDSGIGYVFVDKDISREWKKSDFKSPIQVYQKS